MREKHIEQRLVKAVRRSGGLALKFVSPNLNGVPDRLLLFPGEPSATAGGGNLAEGEVSRNKRCPLCGAASIEAAGGRIAFCEVKAPGEKPRPLQVHRIEQLRSLGFRVYVIDSEEQIEALLGEQGDCPVPLDETIGTAFSVSGNS